MNNAVQAWLQSGQYANLDGIHLMPRPHPLLVGDPLVSIRGQAAAYHLISDQSQFWILKKFLLGRNPDVGYIQGIQAVVPNQPGFDSGHYRRVLAPSSLDSRRGYFSADLAAWIENTILMPVVKGQDWADVADSLRAGTITFSKDQRLALCLSMSERVRCLEANGLSHRDLSSTNVFVDCQTLDLHLIDWDSLYHPTLTMPNNTTFGTEGYIAPFVKVHGQADPQVSWQPHADRFSMAILNAEFLSMEVGSPLTGDGGAFDQDELYQRSGAKIGVILDQIKVNCPGAVALVEQALSAVSFDDCPSPDQWIAAAKGKAAMTTSAAAKPGNRRSFVALNYDALVPLNLSACATLNR